jgi:hypothetical protein
MDIPASSHSRGRRSGQIAAFQGQVKERNQNQPRCKIQKLCKKRILNAKNALRHLIKWRQWIKYVEKQRAALTSAMPSRAFLISA